MLEKGLWLTAAVLAAASFYVVGVATGAVTMVGYEHRSVAGYGWYADHSGIQTSLSGFPVWLRAGRAVRADYDIDAEYGSLSLSVGPPYVLRTELQAATAYLAGRRTGSVLFVAKTAGWYRFDSDASPVFGKSCMPPGSTMIDLLVRRNGCPSYKVKYKVSWHLADGSETAAVRLVVPAPGEKLVTARIGE